MAATRALQSHFHRQRQRVEFKGRLKFASKSLLIKLHGQAPTNPSRLTVVHNERRILLIDKSPDSRVAREFLKGRVCTCTRAARTYVDQCIPL